MIFRDHDSFRVHTTKNWKHKFLLKEIEPTMYKTLDVLITSSEDRWSDKLTNGVLDDKTCSLYHGYILDAAAFTNWLLKTYTIVFVIDMNM